MFCFALRENVYGSTLGVFSFVLYLSYLFHHIENKHTHTYIYNSYNIYTYTCTHVVIIHFCLSIHFSIYSFFLSIYQSAYLSVYVSIYIYLSTYLSIHLSIYPSESYM